VIKTANGLWRRTVEVAKECPPDVFTDYPHADALRLGWFPSKAFFREGADETFWKALPDMSGLLIPYHYDFEGLSHLMVAAYTEDRNLNARRRSIIHAKPQKSRRVAGIFGIHRLRSNHRTLVVTDDELLVARNDGVIAVSNLSPRLMQLMKRSTSVVNLKGSARWLESMLCLSRHGFQVLVEDVPIVEHVRDTIVRLVHEDLGLSVVTDRVAELVKNLVPAERAAVFDLVQQATNLNLERMMPDTFQIYRRESEFYEVVALKLDEKIGRVELKGSELSITTKDGVAYIIPLDHFMVQSAICQIMGCKLDLLDWALRDLKEVPHFYLYRDNVMGTRAEVCRRITEVVITLLTRKARIAHEPV
jgi:hypothetical protein